jgi:ABC-type multidrug transport system fused ATPase/permease subunit
MDEATANVDKHTDTIVHQTIGTNFSDCTVITIAHRLSTIIQNDHIIVISNGTVIEEATPWDLVMEQNGEFS